MNRASTPRLTCIATIGLTLASGAALAQPQITTTVIGTSASTYVPVGVAPALENGMLAYNARTGTSGPDLILAGPVSGPFQIVAREGEQVPGLPAGTLWNRLGSPDVSGGAVFFEGLAGHLFRWQSGIVTRTYNRDEYPGGAGPDLSIPQANAHAIISYKDNAPSFPSGTADVYQTIIGGTTTLLEQCRRRVIGVASARGDWFVYLPVGITPSVTARRFPGSVREVVTDANDAVPGLGEVVAGYAGTSTDGVRASYVASTALGAQQAVCVTPLGMNNAGPVAPLAISGQSAPGGGTFTSFEQTAIGGSIVSFKAFVGGQSGIFCNVGGVNYQIIRSGTSFQGKNIIDVNLGGASADASSVAFRLRYADAALPGGFGYALLVANVTVPCPADLDNDGSLANGGTPDGAVTIEDLLYFIAAYEGGTPAADLDNDGDPAAGVPDGAVTIEDLLYFLARYEGGC